MPPAAPQQGQEEGSTAIIWGITALFVIFGLLWYLFRQQIITGYLLLKLWEIQGLGYVTHLDTISEMKKIIQTANPAVLTFADTVSIGKMVGHYLRIPFTIILVVLAFVVYFSNTTRSLKTIYSMKTLAKDEEVNWPQISPVTGLNLVHDDIDKGIWAMAMPPLQFCQKNDLVEYYRRARQQDVSRREAERIELVLKRGEANKVFSLQLGPRWEGIDKVPPHVKALFAVFAARIGADTKAAATMIAQLNKSSRHKLNFSGVAALCKKHEGSKIVKKITESHAYVLTVMASMLRDARVDGVQATADFLWLKPLDRRLWYMLNTIGRQTSFVESAGPYAHWLAENEAGRKLIIPMVEGATNALELALKTIIFNPEQQ